MITARHFLIETQIIVLNKSSKMSDSNLISCLYQEIIPFLIASKIVNEYDQEKPQSQTADNPMSPRGRAAQPSRDTRKTN